MDADTTLTGSELGGVRKRRRRFHAALVELEAALSLAAGRPLEWRDAVAARLDRMRTTLEDHIAETEGEGGFFEQIIEDAPRLHARVERLRREHIALRAATEQLHARFRSEVPDPDDIDGLRKAVLALLGQAARHRQNGSDLVYEAYAVDVAAGD